MLEAIERRVGSIGRQKGEEEADQGDQSRAELTIPLSVRSVLRIGGGGRGIRDSGHDGPPFSNMGKELKGFNQSWVGEQGRVGYSLSDEPTEESVLCTRRNKVWYDFPLSL